MKILRARYTQDSDKKVKKVVLRYKTKSLKKTRKKRLKKRIYGTIIWKKIKMYNKNSSKDKKVKTFRMIRNV